MLQPKRRKFAKDFRGNRRGIASRGTELAFGEYGLKAMGEGWVTSQQLEAVRRAIVQSLKKGGRVWMRVFPDKPVSSRPAGKRMGGGKGEVSMHVAVVLPGRILFEVAGTTREIVETAFDKAATKLPLKTKIVYKEIGVS